MSNKFKVLHLPLRVSPDEVRIKLTPPLFYKVKHHTLKKIHHYRGIESYYTLKNLPKYEVVGWPIFVVSHKISSGENTCTELLIALDPRSNVTTIFERMKDTRESTTIKYDIEFQIPENFEEDAIVNATKNRLFLLMMRQRRFSMPSLSIQSAICSIVYIPLWVCYYARTSNSIDVKLLDGYSGEKLGAQFRSAFLNALASQSMRP